MGKEVEALVENIKQRQEAAGSHGLHEHVGDGLSKIRISRMLRGELLH